MIGSGAWGNSQSILNEYCQEALGAFVIAKSQREMPDFKEYFRKLKPTTNNRNPWFDKFWETHYNCSLFDSKPPCPHEHALHVVQDNWSDKTYLATYALAAGVDSALHKLCSGINQCNKVSTMFLGQLTI